MRAGGGEGNGELSREEKDGGGENDDVDGVREQEGSCW